MPLPFLKKPRVAGLIMEYRKPDGSGPSQEPEGESNHGLEACAEAAIRAVHAKDAAGLAKAWQDAFEIMESAPHDEYQESEDEMEEGQ